MQGPERNQYPSLTGVRAMAAGLVFLHHAVPANGSVYPDWFSSICAELHIGVGIFFVLSGFLIHNRYSEQFSNSSKGFGSYLLSRFARIFPLFLLLSLLEFLAENWLHPASRENWPLRILLDFSLLKGFSPEYLFSGLPQTWSLTVECCFYLLAPFIFVLCQTRPTHYLKAGMVAALLVFLFTALYFVLPNYNHLWSFINAFTFPGRSFEFLAGCFLSSCLKAASGSFQFKWELLPALAGIFGIVACVAALIFFQQGALSGDIHPAGRLINNLLLPVFICLLFFSFIQHKSILSAFFSSAPLQFAGKISFAFFLIQVGVFQKFISHFISQNLLIQYLLLNLISAALYFLIENPARLFLVRKSGVFLSNRKVVK